MASKWEDLYYGMIARFVTVSFVEVVGYDWLFCWLLVLLADVFFVLWLLLWLSVTLLFVDRLACLLRKKK